MVSVRTAEARWQFEIEVSVCSDIKLVEALNGFGCNSVFLTALSTFSKK